MSWLYLSNPCAFLSTNAHGPAGAVGARLSLRPLFERGTMNCKTQANFKPWERSRLPPRHCERSEAIQLPVAADNCCQPNRCLRGNANSAVGHSHLHLYDVV